MTETQMTCPPEQYYSEASGLCCDSCPAGEYVLTDCDRTTKTKCNICPCNFYTATVNHLKKCLQCKTCNGHVKKKDCMAHEDTQCECSPGFYCEDPDCQNCQPLKRCPAGEGVKVKVTRFNNTVCVPCENQTFSNVTDFTSSCQQHTRCEILGRVEKTPGTPTTDAECGPFKYECPWIVPAALWSGLALTSFFILLAIIIWRTRCKSHRADFSGALTSPVEPMPEAFLPRLPLPSTEVKDHCLEICRDKACETSLIDPDDTDVCPLDSIEMGLPREQPSAKPQVWRYNYINGESGNSPHSFTRNHSEPQENEWCGA